LGEAQPFSFYTESEKTRVAIEGLYLAGDRQSLNLLGCEHRIMC